MVSLKNRFFEAGKFLKPEFTFVYEDFKNAAQQRTEHIQLEIKILYASSMRQLKK